MKLTTLLLPLTTLYSTATATDYFFRLTGSTKFPSLNNERLRTNGSTSPGVTLAPHNPADHFARVAVDNPAEHVWTSLLVVPTNPHPPPVKGYYGLSRRDNIPEAFRFVYTYRPEDEAAAGFEYQDFVLQHVQFARCTPPRWVLDYRPTTGARWYWYVVKEKTEGGVDKWALWYIKRSPSNVDIMDKWEWDTVQVDLVEAGPINSNAPGGVEE